MCPSKSFLVEQSDMVCALNFDTAFFLLEIMPHLL